VVVAVDDGRAEGAPLLAAARGLTERVRAQAAEIEERRSLPPSLVEEMRAAGLFDLLVPFGDGPEADPVLAARVVEEVSYGDGSAGWCVMIAAQNSALGRILPEHEAQTIWGDHRVVAGTARPIGRAVWTTDPAEGYLVTGHWPFASGSSHADWFAAECTVYDGDHQRLNADGDAVTRMLFVPRGAVSLHDTWHTTGLRGTASNDFSIDRAFVPATRGFQVLVDPPRSGSPLYRAMPLVFMNHGTQALGVARAALAAAAELAVAKAG
jgi:alkylation response protein AidB-like acyl-CoA dehydrogenase